MTKLVLTIEADAATLSKLLASLGGSTAVITAPQPTAAIPATGMQSIPTNTGSTDDDESNDADAAPGSLDADGLPWDDRIHSTPAKMTTKGVWRKKRGVQDALVTQVEAELRAKAATAAAPQFTAPPMTQPQPVPMPAQVPPPAPMPEQAAPQPQFTAPPMTQPQPVPMPAQVPPSPQQPQPTMPVPADFNGFMQSVQKLMQEKDFNGNALVDANYLTSLSQQFGATSIMDFASKPEILPQVVNTMIQQGRWR